ncbi:hypothetical protein CSKR_104809 [Clonorchis sinensis]|uniref:Uncharacterized protein n=1 Tax=Clonorchis sinensis TaxID=79923 RepID=A0A419PX52_CLOSI|nr:hypothetical protein CSKR_104809 [Clonorchis sinensis]
MALLAAIRSADFDDIQCSFGRVGRPGQTVLEVESIASLTRFHSASKEPSSTAALCVSSSFLARSARYSSTTELAEVDEWNCSAFAHLLLTGSEVIAGLAQQHNGVKLLGQPGSTSALVLNSGGMAARHRKGVTTERCQLIGSLTHLAVYIQSRRPRHIQPRQDVSMNGLQPTWYSRWSTFVITRTRSTHSARWDRRCPSKDPEGNVVQTRHLASVWKEAIVTPIYKTGDRLSPGSYRPISLTSVPCKVMERILKT